ncbi:MAG: PhzF family isomerase [Oscillospiraceae bacterium]|nr:PhzF family isomerase [Oscillospiraceae bacterium]
MKKYRIYQVDSFTKEKLTGNPAGVVINADGLTEKQMQQIARELNNSETAFILTSDSPDYDVEVRFFTPKMEVPICGHATIAAHYVYAMEKGIKNGRIVQKTKAGILPVDIINNGDDNSMIMTQGTISISEPLADEYINEITTALGISTQDLEEKCPACIASTGHSKVMVCIRSNQQLHSLSPDMAMLTNISKKINCNGYYVFTLNHGEDILVHGRMFAPAAGLNEDPVTGNANGPLGAYLVKYNIEQNENDDTFVFKAAQGEAIGRKGIIEVIVTKENSKPTLVQIKGDAVVVFNTEITL